MKSSLGIFTQRIRYFVRDNNPKKSGRLKSWYFQLSNSKELTEEKEGKIEHKCDGQAWKNRM